MKIKVFLLIIASILFAQTKFYTYTIFMDYREIVNGGVIDKDSTKFGQLNGIGVEYMKFSNVDYMLRAEYAYGSSLYEGQTWGGTPISHTQNGVYILNLEAAAGKRSFFFTLGYREWNRGCSDSSGDYDEKYYWPYFGVMYYYRFVSDNFAFTPKFSYQQAISPKLKVYLGNAPTLDLGSTSGMYIDLPVYFKTHNVTWFVFYRYQYWHINRSNSALLKTSSFSTYIYEPESITQNQYVGVGVTYKF